MRMFFYGTLMNCDLLSHVLGRPIPRRIVLPAMLRGFSRSAVQGLSYPIILRKPTASVRGVMLDGVTAADCDRLCSYEGKNYLLVAA
jgi:hypothetical protein